MSRLFVLGSGGFVPTPARQTSAFLLETRRGAFILDCGTGLSRLFDPMLAAVLARAERVAVLLTHYHHDHIAGVPWLPFFLREKEVHLVLPPRSVTGIAGEEALERFGGSPFLPSPPSEWPSRFPKGFQILEMQEGTTRVFGEKIGVLAAPHTGGSVSLRIRDVTYVTDTVVRPETAAFARESALLLHDCWLDEAGREAGESGVHEHGHVRGAAALAREAGVERLLLIHLNPAYAASRLEEMAYDAAAIFGTALLGTDLLVLDAGRSRGAEEAGEADPGPAA